MIKNSYLKLACLFLITVSSAVWSEGDSSQCFNFHIDQDVLIEFTAQGIDANHSAQTFSIVWHHHPSLQQDTFKIATFNEKWWFITHDTQRWLLSDEKGAVRAMAQHHLREPIMGTILRYDDLELWAHGQYNCSVNQRNQSQFYSSTKSQMWYSLNTDLQSPPSKGEFSGFLKTKRTVTFKHWLNSSFLQNPVPHSLYLNENEQHLQLQLLSLNPLAPANAEQQLHKGWASSLD